MPADLETSEDINQETILHIDECLGRGQNKATARNDPTCLSSSATADREPLKCVGRKIVAREKAPR